MTINVAIVDGDRGALDGLASLIRTTPGLNLVAACRSGHAALCELPVALPRVVLIESNLRDMLGYDGLPGIRAAIPGVFIVVLGRDLAAPTVLTAIAAGADGYIALASSPSRIIEAIFEVSEGGAALCPQAARALVELYQAPPGARVLTGDLTAREKEVLGGHAGGFRAKEVGSWLGISTFTVQTHMRNIYEKTGACSAAHAVYLYCQFGRLTLPPRDRTQGTPRSSLSGKGSQLPAGSKQGEVPAPCRPNPGSGRPSLGGLQQSS